MKNDVVIIGSSLSGLTLALACAQRGIRTRVIERSHSEQQRGSALGIDRSLLLRAIGMQPKSEERTASFPVTTEYRQAVSWRSLHGWLRRLAAQRPEITLIDGRLIFQVEQTDASATAITSDGERIDAEIIVGADGYRSAVRRVIDPDHPSALYAGYLLWRGMVAETSFPEEIRWPRGNEGAALVNEAGYRLVVYPVAGKDDSLVFGQRLISFAWYDKTRDDLLRKTKCVSPDGRVLSSLSPENVPEKVSHELKDLALRIWPEPWKTVIVYAIEKREVFATPAAEYYPQRLHRGRLAVIGDAAHVVSPATGMGFVAGIQDGEALADALAVSPRQPEGGFHRALEDYGRRRLPAAQQLVTRSMGWSRDYLCGAKMPGWATPRKMTENKT